MNTLTYTITRDQLEAKRKLAADSGFVLTGDDGQTPEYRGVVVRYHYQETTLAITVVSKPEWVPEFVIDDQIRKFFEIAQPATGANND